MAGILTFMVGVFVAVPAKSSIEIKIKNRQGILL